MNPAQDTWRTYGSSDGLPDLRSELRSLLIGTIRATSEVGVATTFTVRLGDYSEPMT